MHDRVPIPTDNIFKYYALFGLAVLIFSMGAVLYVGKAANEVVLTNVVEIENLKQQKALTPGQSTRLAVLERQLDIAVSDRKFFLYALGTIVGLSLWLLTYGFAKSHKEIQPLQDEAARVQLEISKIQLLKLQGEIKEDN